ncbi:MAG: carboxypeptidase regulatory-like domain-containing protein [Planctomycetota bacterium]
MDEIKIEGVTPGAYNLKVRVQGFAPTEVEGIKLAAGQELNVGEIALGKGVTLIGSVTGADGEAVANATVAVNEAQKGGFFGMGFNSPVASGMTDTDGNFEISGLAEGDWVLTVAAEGFANYEEPVKIHPSGNRKDVKLSKGGTVTGLVKDAKGQPAKNVRVSLLNHNSQIYQWYKMQPDMARLNMGSGDKSANTDESGRFEITNIVAGTYLLFATSENNDTVVKDNVKVENDRELDAGTLQFEGGGSAKITVLEDGKPIREVKVSLSSGQWGGDGQNSGVTDDTGVTLIEDIAPGTYFVRTDLERDTFDTDAMAKRRIVVVSGKTVEFTLELRPQDGVHLHGRLTMNGELVFTEVMLIGQGSLANTIKTFKIAESGMYEFHGLKHGTYQLHAKISDDQPTAFRDVTLTQDGDSEFSRDFVGVRVSGTVNTPENSPEERAAVTMIIQDKKLQGGPLGSWLRGTMTVTNEGKFEMSNVPEGEYQITAELAGVGTVVHEFTVQGGDVSGITMNVVANSGSLEVTVKDFIGEPISAGGFAQVQLYDSNGELVTFSQQMTGVFMLSKGAVTEFPMVKPDTYKVKVSATGFLSAEVKEVVVKLNAKTQIEVTMQAASELHLTVTNSEVTQAMLDTAVVKVIDAEGKESAPTTSMLDLWANQAPPTKPTLFVRYLPPEAKEIRIKVAGYAEFTVQVETQPGTKNEKQETLVSE